MDTAAALPTTDKAPHDGARSAKRSRQLEKAQDSALAALSAASWYLDADVPTYFGRLSETLAAQTHAARVAFWRLGPGGKLMPQPRAFGFADDLAIPELSRKNGEDLTALIDRIVFNEDLQVVKGTSPDLDQLWDQAGLMDITSSIAAPWRAGDRRIGMVAAFNSRHGFMPQDLWLLRLTGMAAGLVWQYKEAEDDLGQTAVRLEEAMAARRHLLNNIAAGGDEARRRFASALHDDSLQLLTGAELQLERVQATLREPQAAAQLDQLKQTLRKVEDSLRRLLINVSPEPIQLSGNLRQAISERLEEIRVRAGIETRIETRLPDDIPAPTQTLLLKNISEALNNVEKHARATRVTVVAEEADGVIRVEITDDGTGFVVGESFRVPGHIGLVALRERSQLAGGTCRIDSDPGAGTTIEFWVPMTL